MKGLLGWGLGIGCDVGPVGMLRQGRRVASCMRILNVACHFMSRRVVWWWGTSL